MLPEPGEQALPAVFGFLPAVARPVIGVERVRRVFVDVNARGLAGGVTRGDERGAHLLQGGERDALVLPPVETEHRAVQLAGDVDRSGVAQRLLVKPMENRLPRLKTPAIKKLLLFKKHGWLTM